MPAAGERLSPVELKEQLAAERRGTPFLAYRDAAAQRTIVALGDECSRLTIGRSAACDIWLDWDVEASSLHAAVERLGEHWVLGDDGLSRNGTWVNGKPVRGQHRLRNGDRIQCGQTVLVFHQRRPVVASTVVAAGGQGPPRLSDAQRRVLVAFCRPLVAGGEDGLPGPATNPEIAAELVLSVEAVKTHMRALFEKFEISELPQNRKRARLAELAFERGAVVASDLRPVAGDG